MKQRHTTARIILATTVAITVFVAGPAIAQPLEPGQHLPDIALTGLHQPGAPRHLAAYNNTPLIIAFWSPTCHASMQTLAKMDSLQRKFKGRLQFLVANRQDKDSTRRLFQKLKLPENLSYPVISAEKRLDSLFPHRYFPWQVWIDRTGTVQYITAASNLTERNIEKFLAGEKIPVVNRKFRKNHDPWEPLMAQGGGNWLQNIPFYFYIAHCDFDAPIANTTAMYWEKEKRYKYSMNCATATELLIYAFGEEGRKYDFQQAGTVQLLVKDTTAYRWPSNIDEWDRWQQQYTYSFDMNIAAERVKESFPIIQDNLMRFFNLEARVVKRKMPCLVLVRTTTTDKLRSKGGTPFTNIVTETEEPVRYINNYPFQVLSGNLRNICILQRSPKPFVDATGYKGNIDFKVNRLVFDQLQLPALRKQLRHYGLDLMEKECMINVLVIREKQKE